MAKRRGNKTKRANQSEKDDRNARNSQKPKEEPVANPVALNKRTEHEGNCPPEAKKQRVGAVEEAEPSVQLSETDSTCGFCTDHLPPGSGIVLDSCGCAFCKQCVEDAVINSTSASVKCLRPPNDDGSSCPGVLLDREVKYAVSDGRFEEYLARSLKEAQKEMANVYHCKTPDCAGWCEIDVDEGSSKRSFACEVCSKINCTQCKAVHEGLSCEKYAEIVVNAAEGTGQTSGPEFDTHVESQMKSVLDHLINSTGNPILVEDALLQTPEPNKLLPPIAPFTCEICLDDIEPQNGALLHNCLHPFCKACLQSHIFHCTDPQVQCPLQEPDGTNCPSFLTPREIQGLCSKEILQDHLDRSLKQAELVIENTFHCANPDCNGWCIIEEEDKNEKAFKCPVCWKETCVDCKVCHPGVSCAYYKNSLRSDNNKVQAVNEKKSEEALKKFIHDKKVMRCPRCKYISQKISGCSSVRCPACKFNYTWKAKTIAKL